MRSGFFVGKLFDKLRFVVKTSVLQIGFECSRAIGVFQERDVWALTPYYHRILPSKNTSQLREYIVKTSIRNLQVIGVECDRASGKFLRIFLTITGLDTKDAVLWDQIKC